MKKILIIAGILILAGGIVGFSIWKSQQNIVVVQTSKVKPEDLFTIVTASGEIKPKTYVNVGANAFGKIIKLYVKEGDHVKRGEVVAQLENVQSTADVAAQQATLSANRTDAVAANAGANTSVADLERAQVDAERAKLEYDRAQSLFKEQLIPKADFDAKKAAYDSTIAQVAQAKARIAQGRAQALSAEDRIKLARALLTRSSDALSKTTYVAPFAGVVTNLPVREGETVVIGIQNAPGSTLMTIADMSVITAEVKVDETDIVNVRLGQTADVTVDAIPSKVFKGHVSEIGDNAILRSSGLATSQTTSGSQEAKDFKVVVTLDAPPEGLRPGLSTTAKITTATRSHVLAIPIQALTIRQQSDIDAAIAKAAGKPAPAAGAATASAATKKSEELQGVFVIRKAAGKIQADFQKVETGITGMVDIEIVNGLKENDEIVTGSYKVLRTLKPSTRVKVDNAAPKKEEG